MGDVEHVYSDYPYTTVPNQVERLFRAQLHHDRKHYDERIQMGAEARAKTPYIDYLRPIIADADMGYAIPGFLGHIGERLTICTSIATEVNPPS